MPLKRTLTAASALAIMAAVTATAQAAINQNDIVVGLNTGFKSTSAGTETHPTTQWQAYYNTATGTWSAGPGPSGTEPSATFGGANASWDVQYLEDVVFDNTAGKYHNASGNLLAASYGNSFTGFTIYGLETQGGAYNGGNADAATIDYTTGISAGLWSVKNVTKHSVAVSTSTSPYIITKGSLTTTINDTERGVGLSVSPLNNRVAWLGVDSGVIAVQDYNAGTTPGSVTVTGSVGSIAGASISGTRLTATGNFNGGSGLFPAVGPGGSGDTTWLNNNVVLAFSGNDGRLTMWNIANVSGGNDNGAYAGVTSQHVGGGATDFNPNIDASWKTAFTMPLQATQSSAIYYNPAIDPSHIYAAVTASGTYEGYLYRLNFDGTSGAITLDKTLALPTGTGQALEPRDMAMDSEGNLYFGNYTDANKSLTQLVTKLTNATDGNSWTTNNLVSLGTFTTTADGKSFYSAYTHLDVAASTQDGRIFGDFNSDELVNGDDYTVWASNYGWQGYYNAADANLDGLINGDDYTVWASHYATSIGATLAEVEAQFAAVPEPASLTLIAAAGLMALRRRRNA